MFLRASIRKKDGKVHRYFSVVENKRVGRGRVVQRHVLYLGEINDSQERAWRKSIEVFEEGSERAKTLSLFAEDCCEGLLPDASVVRVKLSELRLERPRQWGACCPGFNPGLWQELQLDRFWHERLPTNRKGTRFDLVLFVLVAYRLLSPGSEWRLHREWYGKSALADLLGEDFGLAESHKLYACHDLLLAHKQAVFDHLTGRWRDLFNAKFDVLLYDLTSTYFEADPPFPEGGKRRHGYSRDHRPDCVQVVIALIVTPEGLPLAYEVLAGNTSDKTTLKGFLERIERQYGKAQRIWLMDRGIPTEEVLTQMRASEPPVQYLVGTPKGRLSKLEQALLAAPWQQARENVAVKLLPQDGELYVFAESRDRVAKERAMRRRQLKWLWKRLAQIAAMKLTREEILMKLGSARSQAPTAWRLVDIDVDPKIASLTYRLNRKKLAKARRREGRYLLRTNLADSDPARLWELYLTLVKIEEAFKNLKSDLALRPIFHQREDRIEAHIFIAFLAYCLHVTLGRRLHALAPGLTPRSVLEKFAAVQMIDVHIPTTDARTLTLTRYTEPEPELKILLDKLKLDLPPQRPPKITATLAPPPNLL
ncbi:MAG TPA: IS1634 family transposase [Aestuariivirgaceae bacterium]|nr:IS1634 family transposase [Aestuariivirgaceae bacterium]